MKKIFAWICAIAGIIFLTASASGPLMTKVWKWKNDTTMRNVWYGKNNNQWGDLSNMGLLDGIKKFHEPKGYKFINAADDGTKNIDLYILGDSHVEDVPGYAFANTSSYYFGRGLVYSLNQSKKNILIIETAERFALSTFYNNEVYSRMKQKGDPRPLSIIGNEGRKNYSRVINKNLEVLLFDYNFINVLRRDKAELTYSLFERAAGDVSLSENEKYLFFRPTILPYGIYSSYSPLSDSTVNETVANMNKMYDFYKKEGFSEVYFSIIPNPATLLQPDDYNNLVPRIRDNPSLRMPGLDIYDIYKKNPNPSMLYRLGDTHWNDNGMQIWLNVVNAALRKESMKGR